MAPPKKTQQNTNPGDRGQSSVRRESVARARQTSGNKTQLIILGVAVVLIAVVIVWGLVLNKTNDTRRNDAWAGERVSTATLEDGVITVAVGSPKLTIDIYEDALCPVCGQFEHKFGLEIAEPVNAGKLAVRYHMMNFLDYQSASGSYSTRAAAAMECVAAQAGDVPGAFEKFHEALFSRDFQPAEGGDSDPSNADLAALATQVGAAAASDCISTGTAVESAGLNAEAASASLQAVGGTGTPSVVHDGELILKNDDWLVNLLAGS